MLNSGIFQGRHQTKKKFLPLFCLLSFTIRAIFKDATTLFTFFVYITNPCSLLYQVTFLCISIIRILFILIISDVHNNLSSLRATMWPIVHRNDIACIYRLNIRLNSVYMLNK